MPFDSPIEKLGLGATFNRRMIENGVKTVGDLMRQSEDSLRKNFRGIGFSYIGQAERALAQHGYKLHTPR